MRLELGIGGMTCTTCSGAIERCLQGTPGVESAEVMLLQEKAGLWATNRHSNPAFLLCSMQLKRGVARFKAI